MDITEELPTVLSLCSGYGGIERGFDLAGFKHRVLSHVEIEAFAIANLVNKMEANLLPPAPIYTDLKTLPVEPFRDRVDILTGGYPCQPFSAAGKRLGEDDPRHLWPYIKEIIRAVRPVRCFFENVEGHISLGLREVIADLESLGYKTTWGIFSAREVGAPHQRKRVYILADSSGAGQQTLGNQSERKWEEGFTGKSSELADSSGEGLEGPHDYAESPERVQLVAAKCGSDDEGLELADSDSNQQRPRVRQEQSQRYTTGQCSSDSGTVGIEGVVADSICTRSEARLSGQERSNKERDARVSVDCGGEHGRWQIGMPWPAEPQLGRVVDGCADRVDRIRMLGNGVVPQTAAKAWLTLNGRLAQ